MSPVTVGALVVFVVAWLGALASFLGFGLLQKLRRRGPDAGSIWLDPNIAPQFLVYTGFCTIGVIAMFVAVLGDMR
ncbi:MAG: hypothetical protein ABUL42_03310 [Terricaulis silvestris]